MSTLSFRLPESLHKQLRELAAKEGTSINQLAASALGEKTAALMTAGYHNCQVIINVYRNVIFSTV